MKKNHLNLILGMSLCLTGITAAGAGELPVWEQKADLGGIVAHVPPLRHPLPAGWQPTLFWWQAPLSFDQPVKLKEELQALAARGMLPCIELEAEYNVAPQTVDRRVAEGKAVAAAGFPVHLAMKGALDLYRLPDGKLVCHTDSPDAGKKGDVGNEFPCLLLQDGWKARAEHIRGLMKKFADAKVPVAGVWYDYEGYPYVWNGMMGHIARCPSCQKEFKTIPALQKPPKEFPPLSDGFDLWVGWSSDFYTQAIVAGFAQPVREVLPAARIGFYGFTTSSAASPTGGGNLNPAEIDVAQPIGYAQPNNTAGAYFTAKGAIPPAEIDQAYFLGLLGAVTGVVKNLRPNQVMIPFVCGFCDGNDVIPRMSRSLYREFLRHAVLRGARGFYCFNTAPPYTSMAYYYAELADIGAVCDELFAYPEFLTGGETLNHDWFTFLAPTTAKDDWRQPGNTKTWSRGAIIDGLRVWLPTPKVKDASVWSGLRRGDKALIRTVTLGETPKFIDITPFPGVTVRLLAPTSGATYVVERSGHFEAME